MEEAKGLKDLERADVVHFVSKILSRRAEVGQLSVSTNWQHKPLKQDKLRRKTSNLEVPTGVRLMCRASMMLRWLQLCWQPVFVLLLTTLCASSSPSVPGWQGVDSDPCLQTGAAKETELCHLRFRAILNDAVSMFEASRESEMLKSACPYLLLQIINK